MAAGALPIVSPLDTIRPIVNEHTFFSLATCTRRKLRLRYLAPDDDVLVNRAAEANLPGYAAGQPFSNFGRAHNFYKELAKRERAKTVSRS